MEQNSEFYDELVHNVIGALECNTKHLSVLLMYKMLYLFCVVCLCVCVSVLLQVGPCGEVRAYIMALWGVRDLSPTCGDPHKE